MAKNIELLSPSFSLLLVDPFNERKLSWGVCVCVCVYIYPQPSPSWIGFLCRFVFVSFVALRENQKISKTFVDLSVSLFNWDKEVWWALRSLALSCLCLSLSLFRFLVKCNNSINNNNNNHRNPKQSRAGTVTYLYISYYYCIYIYRSIIYPTLSNQHTCVILTTHLCVEEPPPHTHLSFLKPHEQQEQQTRERKKNDYGTCHGSNDNGGNTHTR